MKKVNILSEGFKSPNVRALLFPLIVNRESLKDYNIEWELFTKNNKSIAECDVLIIESKYHGLRWRNEEKIIIDELAYLKEKVKSLYYFDTSDSTALLHHEVLPYVNKYYKGQILSNINLYMESHYGNRIFTDYIHNNFNIHDAIPSYSSKITDKNLLNKIDVSWNSSLANYSWLGKYRMEVYSKIKYPGLLGFPNKYVVPSLNRNNDVSCRINTNYYRDTVAYFRYLAKEKLKKWTDIKRVSLRKYYQELESSKIVVSPFAWGEINYKDYETFLSGAILLKPDMSHLKTWPDLYSDMNTMVAYDWNAEDLNQKIDTILANYNEYIDIAINAQQNYKNYLIGEDAANNFCRRFSNIL